jgi:hypothetical protein
MYYVDMKNRTDGSANSTDKTHTYFIMMNLWAWGGVVVKALRY